MLFRLLIPFSIPFIFSVYSLLHQNTPVEPSVVIPVNYVRPVNSHIAIDLLENAQQISYYKVSSPLTYGIFHPVILMPKQTDWKNTKELQYILSHEYVHIYHYDIARKLIAIIAICIHWFNPFVWGMYFFFNRDMELACDESVVHMFGETSKSTYARMLISMETKKRSLTPFCNHFSKNAIEERITAIMKI